MADKLTYIFQNSPSPNSTVDAGVMNNIVKTLNDIITELNATKQTLERVSKSELIVLATKSTQLSFSGNGQPQVIDGWIVKVNKESGFVASSGVLTFPQSGTYTTIVKTLISADNATSPRSKISIIGNGNEIGLSEDTVFSTLNQNVANYRITHAADATNVFNKGQTLQVNAQVWGASTARIFADANTQIAVYREIT